MKLPQASLLATVLLRLACIHARAITVACLPASGGTCTLTARWSRQRISTFNPHVAADGVGRATWVPEACLDAWFPITANGSPAAECPSPVSVVADMDSVEAAVLPVESRGNTGSSPPGPGVAGKGIVFLSDCDNLLDAMNQRQSIVRLEQPKWLNLGRMLCGIHPTPSATTPAVSDSRPSSLVLIL